MIKDLFYQFVLYKDLSVEGSKVISNIFEKEINKGLIEFLYSLDLKPILLIKNATWEEACIELEINYMSKEVELTFLV